MKIEGQSFSKMAEQTQSYLVSWKNRTVAYLKESTLPKSVAGVLLLVGGAYLAKNRLASSESNISEPIVMSTDDAKEGIASYVERRTPRFTGK